MEKKFQYTIQVAIVNQTNGKAYIKTAIVVLDKPFGSIYDLNLAFFSQWDNKDKYNGDLVTGVLGVTNIETI